MSNAQTYNQTNSAAEVLARSDSKSAPYGELHATIKAEAEAINKEYDNPEWSDYATQTILDAVDAGFITMDEENRCTLIVPLNKAVQK